MLREIISPISKLFSFFNLRISTTNVGRELPKRLPRVAVEQASIRSDGYNQPSRIFHKSILQIQLVGETRNGTKIEINYFESKSHLSLSLYTLCFPPPRPHLCCLADKRLVSSLFLVSSFFSPLRFLQREKIFQGENRQHRRDSLESSLARSRSSVRRIDTGDEEKKWW